MKRFNDLPVYFILVGLMLNMIMYFNYQVSFENLMIRSIIIILLFAGTGYILSNALNSAHKAWKVGKKQREVQEKITSTIDIKVKAEEDDELLKIIPPTKEEEFVEINPQSFKKFMDQD
jgi:hypothetical protein